MKKIRLILLLAAGAVNIAAGQDNEAGSASQSTRLVMSNAIDITFNAGGTSQSEVSLAFNNVNDYANGVESSPIEMKIRSNKKFDVFAKTSASRFAYSGPESKDPKMNVNKLKIKVVSNNTGGSVPSAVNNKYSNMSKSNKKLINDGTPGGDNVFAVQYKADPGFEFPAGTYSVEVIYTATQQ